MSSGPLAGTRPRRHVEISGWAWRDLLNTGMLLTLISRLLWAIDRNIRINSTGQAHVLYVPPPSVSFLSHLLTLSSLSPQFSNTRTNRNRHPSSATTRTVFDRQPFELVFSDEIKKSKTAPSTKGTTPTKKPSTSGAASQTI